MLAIVPKVEQLPLPSQLTTEGQWLVIRESDAICTQTNGDWKAYTHLSGSKLWRERMRPAVSALTNFLEQNGIWLECPIPGCNMQGCYCDHVTSTSGWHFKNLWQKTKLFADGVPLEEMKRFAWEQKNIGGGAVRFNHLDWEIQMWKGPPPASPSVFQTGASDMVPAPTNAGLQVHSAIPIHVPVASYPSIQNGDHLALQRRNPDNLPCVVDLPDDEEWRQFASPLSHATCEGGDWKTLPHLCGGRAHWRGHMLPRADYMGKILMLHNITTFSCDKCGQSRGWEEHVPGPEHYKRICSLLGDQLIEHAKLDLWQSWDLCLHGVHGRLCFNHLDGEVMMIRLPSASASGHLRVGAPPPPREPPPFAQPPQVGRETLLPSSLQPRQVASLDAPDAQHTYQLRDHDFPGFHLAPAESKVEAWIDGSWTRVSLIERRKESSEKCWEVEEYWGGHRHVVNFKSLRHCSECMPSNGFEVGQYVCYAQPKSPNYLSLAMLPGLGGVDLYFEDIDIPAKLLSREIRPDKRKAWRILINDGANSSREEIVLLEHVLEAQQSWSY